MDTQIHDHIRHWLEASMKGRLTRAQCQALRGHLGECAACQRVACEPDWVATAEQLLSRRAAVSADLEAQVLAGLRVQADDERARLALRRQRQLRIAVRVGLLVAVLVLLGVRSLNVHYVRQDTMLGQALSASAQVFLREPRYDTLSGLPEALGSDERALAVAHQLVKGCVGMLLWLCLFLLGGLTLLDLWRRTHRLGSVS
jgi:predicted anti-sigma-YlaC factor YlaD